MCARLIATALVAVRRCGTATERDYVLMMPYAVGIGQRVAVVMGGACWEGIVADLGTEEGVPVMTLRSEVPA